MIDPKLLRQDFEGVKQKLQFRALPEQFDEWPQLDAKRRDLLGEFEAIRAEKNKLGPEIAKAKKAGTDAAELLAQLKDRGERESALERELAEVNQALSGIELLVPNIPHESVPVGKDEHANVVQKEWGTKPEFSFKPKQHWEIGEALGILDFERGAKLSGSRFTVYRGNGAKLERALIGFMLDRHAKKGYTEIMPPLMVREEAMIGSGQLPKFYDDVFKTADFEPRLFLIPTSEVALCNMHADEILEASQLPIYYTSYTPCFRAEAGSHGRDVRGLIRQHQFNKVELVKATLPEQSFEEHEKMTRDAESILEELGLAYRRVTLSSGDMGMAAAKTSDLEVWLPGMDAYREISSCSNTLDFQSRRNQSRFRRGPKEKPELVHLLNGSGLAVGRTLVAILENYQQEDGSIKIPKALQPFIGGLEQISKA